MPNLSRCKQKDGKLFCWDSDKKQVVEIKTIPLEFNQVPSDVLAGLIEDGDKPEGVNNGY